MDQAHGRAVRGNVYQTVAASKIHTSTDALSRISAEARVSAVAARRRRSASTVYRNPQASVPDHSTTQCQGVASSKPVSSVVSRKLHASVAVQVAEAIARKRQPIQPSGGGPAGTVSADAVAGGSVARGSGADGSVLFAGSAAATCRRRNHHQAARARTASARIGSSGWPLHQPERGAASGARHDTMRRAASILPA